MRTRRSQARGALTSIAVALLAGIVLSGTFAAADAPWPQHSPAQDAAKYEQYAYSCGLPDDCDPASGDYWKYTGDESGTAHQVLIDLFHPGLDRSELDGAMGASVDGAWSVTTGRPDVVIAHLDSGMRWHDAAAMGELARKCRLNPGELPPPHGADCWDFNGDGVFNVDDYAGDARVADLNANGIIDPQDIIWRFSDGEDGDDNGYADDICGWDFLEDDNDPWDETDGGHGTAGGIWSAGEANNGNGMVGTCPNAMLLPVRVGYSFVVDVNDFAQGVVFAVDSGAWVVQAALVGVNNTAFAQSAIDYAYSRGVAVIASAGVGGSAQNDYPAACERTIQVNAVQKYVGSGTTGEEQFPPSYLYLGGQTNYGARNTVCAPSDGHSSGAVARSAGIAALVYSAAENEVQRGEMWRYPGLETPLSSGEVKQIIAMTADDIDFSPGSYVVTLGSLDAVIGPSERYRSHRGWDPYFGYGRINAHEAVMAVDQGRIPPEAEISSPAWFELINPGQVNLEVTGKVAAVRADSYQYTVEWAPGWDPGEDEWTAVSEDGPRYEPYEGVLASLDLGTVYGAVMDGMQVNGGGDDPGRYAFSVRVRVRDNLGNWGEDHKVAYCFHDPDAYPGSPVDLGSSITASPRFADLDDDGEDELIVATGDGLVHAFESDLGEVPGWPVHVTPLPLHEGSQGFKSGQVGKVFYASITGTPAVGDLDHDGSLEVVAGDMEGRLYAWNQAGETLPGFPVRSNPLYSIPDRADWWTEGALPDEWHASRFVPDRVHSLDRWNRLDNAFPRGPVLCNLDSSVDGSLEIIAACEDQHVYAWHADGGKVRGWPHKLVDPEKVSSLDPLTHTCEFPDTANIPGGGRIITNPSVADLDGDGDPEVICGTNEAYAGEPFNVSALSFGLAAYFPALEPMTGVAGGAFGSCNTRVYAMHHDGAAHGLEAGAEPAPDAVSRQAYLEGWPVKLAVAAPGMLPEVLQGVGGPAAIADIDGDGVMEIGVFSAAGPGYLLEPDGTSFLGNDGSGLPLSLRSNEAGSSSSVDDLPLMCAWGGGSFATLGEGGLSFVAPVMGLGRAGDMYLPADQTRSDDAIAAWNASDGSMLSPFPARVNGTLLSVTPGAADIDGDGVQEVLAGSAGRDFHAVNAAGVEPAGWPKFTGGCSTVTPAVGDMNVDGSREVAAGTREGWLLIWETASSSADAADWPQYGHDAWNTGCLHGDAARPGRVTDLAVEKIMEEQEPRGIRLAWTAPGDDGFQGQALCYEIRFSSSPIGKDNWEEAIPLKIGKPMPGEAGSPQEYSLQGFPFANPAKGTTLYFALQARDEAGNLSALSNLASVSYAE